MRKRELVHLHALLDRIRRHLRDHGEDVEGTYEEYESLDVSPAAVYRSKRHHEDAVRVLAESLADAVDDGDAGEGDDDEPSDRPRKEPQANLSSN